jgi:H+/gluconate symporter-like permease
VRESDLPNEKISTELSAAWWRSADFFCPPGVWPNINQKERNTKVKTLIAIALFAASIVGAYAQVHVNSYYRSNGTYVREHYRSYPDGIESNNWSYRGF